MSDDVVKVLRDIEWQLGAIASQMAMANRLKAKEMGIPVVFHDPSVEPWPAVKHGDAGDVTVIRQGVPRHMRTKPA